MAGGESTAGQGRGQPAKVRVAARAMLDCALSHGPTDSQHALVENGLRRTRSSATEVDWSASIANTNGNRGDLSNISV
eukprot:864200-Pleurochrysis_carterae.AAC.1